MALSFADAAAATAALLRSTAATVALRVFALSGPAEVPAILAAPSGPAAAEAALAVVGRAVALSATTARGFEPIS
jgi:hypothetical protein